MTADARFLSREQYYAGVADRRARAFYRDPVIEPGAHGRADVASGRMSKWARFNNPDSLVWLDTPEGRTVALTRNQLGVLYAARELAGGKGRIGTRVTTREIGARLGIAASSVYRACVKLQALGLIVYQSNRGRLGGYMFLLREAKDGLDWMMQDAKEKLRRWRKAAEARISRLRGNVASCFPGRERELYEHRYVTETRAQHFPPWTPEDFREAGLM